MNVTETVYHCHAIVWDMRRTLAHVWPTPNAQDSIRFAATEAGEALDAYLRTRPEFSRNRQRDHDELDEWADCAMMLLTAISPDYIYLGESPLPVSGDPRTRDELVADVTDMLRYRYQSPLFMLRAVGSIAVLPGMHLPTRLRSRLARIRERVAPTHKTVPSTYLGDITPLE